MSCLSWENNIENAHFQNDREVVFNKKETML